jgi:hypothetical protein
MELKTLNLSKNRLNDVPESLCYLTSLRVLNLEKNRLINIPHYINQLSLLDFRIGHNQIEHLGDDLFNEQLGKILQFFSCVENNLLELPISIMKLSITCVLEADYNPLISPPPYLLSDEFLVLQNYFKLRNIRRKLLYELMKLEDFELSMESFAPIACEVLEDGTGFLTPDDLAAFDQAVQEFLNGEYYKCPATVEELVQRVTKLREERETEMYLLLIRHFLKVLNDITIKEKDPRFSPPNIMIIQRPWGSKGELVNCYAVSLNALLRELPRGHLLYPEGRPSIFNMIAASLPPMAFPFTMDLLKDSIRLYLSPYGIISNTEEISFLQCDCVDEIRNRPKKHDPCQKAAVVIAKSVYVEEEAQRREVEEDEFLERFEAVEDELHIWIGTEEGRKGLETEVKRRKNVLKEEITLREEMILSQHLKQKKKHDEIHGVEVRMELFLAGAPYEQHGFYNVEDATKQIEALQVDVQKFQDRIDILKNMLQGFKDKYNVEWKQACSEVFADLVQKYCVIAYNDAVQKFRKTAAENCWNRYWDGEDGKSFEDWSRSHHIERIIDNNENENDNNSEPPPGTPIKRTESGMSDGQSSKRRKDDLEPEYDWKDTQQMDKFKLKIYTEYRNKAGPVVYNP